MGGGEIQKIINTSGDASVKTEVYNLTNSVVDVQNNISLTKEEIKKKFKDAKCKIFAIDASKIAIETIGSNFPNTALLAAIIRVTGLMDKTALEENMMDSFKHKFAKKPEVIDGNMKALEMALKEVTKV